MGHQESTIANIIAYLVDKNGMLDYVLFRVVSSYVAANGLQQPASGAGTTHPGGSASEPVMTQQTSAASEPSNGSFKERLRQGDVVLGCMTKHPGASTVEALGSRGWDFIIIDAEHGAIDPLECEHMTRAVEASGCEAIVRVPENTRACVTRYLDVGPRGLQMPMVESREHAEAMDGYATYWPRGERGLAAVRPASYGAIGGLAAYTARLNAELLLVAQIETASAVAVIDEIVAVPSLDVIFIGPTDLANSLGVLGEPASELLADSIERIVDATLAASKVLGVMARDEADAARWLERGARYISFLFENVLGRGSAGLLDLPRGL